ncbi:hypothetical protein D3C81_1302630 [compost metagenome]
MLVFTQCQIDVLHLLQPLADDDLGGRRRDHRQGVDEQTDLLLDARQIRRTPGNRGAEGHMVLPGITLQQHQPRRLHQGVEGDFLLAGEAVQVRRQGFAEYMRVIGVTAGRVLPARHGTGQTRRLIKISEGCRPEIAAGLLIALIQPFDVIAIAPLPDRWGQAGITLQHFAEQLRGAPAVHEDVMAGVNQVMRGLVRAHQRHPQQRRASQVETVGQVLAGQLLQRRAEVSTTAPVLHAPWHLRTLTHHLYCGASVLWPDKCGAQDLVGINGLLPG